MYIGEILKADIANGTGMRVSVFVSGCRNRCEGCFQPETWDFHYGREYTPEMEDQIIEELSAPYYDGITILGGDPMEEENQPEVCRLLLRIKKELPRKSVWIYTGYIYEEDLIPGKRRYFGSVTEKLLGCTDVMVDGPFIQEKKNISLRFRGSENQRIINIPKTLENGEVIISDFNKQSS